jgi:hypothetical protein
MLEKNLRLATGVILVVSFIALVPLAVHSESISTFLPKLLLTEGTAGLLVAIFCLIARRKRIPAELSYVALVLYVVLFAYIGLAALDSLNCARCKGPNAAIMGDLNTIQTQAEIYYGGEGMNTYGQPVPLATSSQACEIEGSLFASQAVKDSLSSLEADGGSIECMSDGGAYAALSSLPSEKDLYWCVDSTGNAYSTRARLSSTVCPVEYIAPSPH